MTSLFFIGGLFLLCFSLSRTIQEIWKLQETHCLLLRKLPFQRLVWEIAAESHSSLWFQGDAILALQVHNCACVCVCLLCTKHNGTLQFAVKTNLSACFHPWMLLLNTNIETKSNATAKEAMGRKCCYPEVLFKCVQPNRRNSYCYPFPHSKAK